MGSPSAFLVLHIVILHLCVFKTRNVCVSLLLSKLKQNHSWSSEFTFQIMPVYAAKLETAGLALVLAGSMLSLLEI